MRKFAAAHLRDGRVFIGPLDRTRVGLHIHADPVTAMDLDDLYGIEAGIRKALDASRSEIEDSDFSNWNVNDNPAQRAARVKTWREFIQGTSGLIPTFGTLGFWRR